MSRETMEHLNTNTLIGYTDKRGTAWHYRADLQATEQSIDPLTLEPITVTVSNHFPGPVPIDAVQKRLFGWTAESRPVFVVDSAGTMVEVPNRQAIIRSDTNHVMGIFTDSYARHQFSEWLLGTVGTMLDDSLSIGSAGLLRGGAVAWVSIEVPENVTTPEGVTFRPHLLACTSHDGTLATTFQRVVTNVVCDNTMSAALGEATSERVKVKHSRNSGFRIGEARAALGLVLGVADDFSAQVAQLCATTVTDRQWSAFLDMHAELPAELGRAYTLAESKRADLTGLWNADPRVSPWHGTAYGVVQAVNTHAHHLATVRGAERAERNTLRAVRGEVDTLDRATMAQLARVLAS